MAGQRLGHKPISYVYLGQKPAAKPEKDLLCIRSGAQNSWRPSVAHAHKSSGG